MHSSQRSPHRRSQARPCAEVLENRSLLTGGAGNIFALVPGAIADTGGKAVVQFNLSPTEFTAPKGKLTLGIDVIPRQSSNLEPMISQVNNPPNTSAPQGIRSNNHHRVSRAQLLHVPGTSAVLTPLALSPNQPGEPANYSVTISAQKRTNGNFLAGFYLPGDADGNGVVDQSDINIIKAAQNSKNGDKNYKFDADANRDGRISRIDLNYAKKNLGVKTTVTPIVTANLDAASDTGDLDRNTMIRDVHFMGTGSPDSTITFSEINQKITNVSTTTDADGNYDIIVSLGEGMNTLEVTSVDAFGQTISGQISPVTYTPDPANPTPYAGLPLPDNLAT
jgi:Dockerin type I domain/Bacterial Ig-like domain